MTGVLLNFGKFVLEAAVSGKPARLPTLSCVDDAEHEVASNFLSW